MAGEPDGKSGWSALFFMRPETVRNKKRGRLPGTVADGGL